MGNTIIRKLFKEKDVKYLYMHNNRIPAWFSGVNDEYETAKESIVYSYRFDLKQIFISGEDRNRLIDKVTTADLSKSEFYNIEITAMCDTDGCVIDMLLMYVFGDGIFIIVDSYKSDKVLEILESEKGEMKCEVMDISDRSSIYTFIGPSSMKVIDMLTNSNMEPLETNEFSIEPFNNSEIIISRSDVFGLDTYEVMIESDSDELFFDMLEELRQKENLDIKPIGLLAFNTLRLERGVPIMMNEFSKASLLESKLDNIINFDKEDFIGKDALLKEKEAGISRSLFLGAFDTYYTVNLDQAVYNKDKKKSGFITSSAYSPHLKKTVVMGYINIDENFENNEIYLKLGKHKERVKGEIIPPVKY